MHGPARLRRQAMRKNLESKLMRGPKKRGSERAIDVEEVDPNKS